MKRGQKNIRELGKIIKFNGEELLSTWFGDECNEVKGTDGTIYPPHMKKEDGVWLYVPQLCRSFGAEYKHPSKVSGIRTNHFEVNITAPSSCYCRNSEKCFLDGSFDMFPCVGIPLVLTAPHFYKGNLFFSLNQKNQLYVMCLTSSPSVHCGKYCKWN